VGVLKKGPAVALSKLLGTLHEFRGKRRDLRVAMVRGLLFWTVVVASQSLFIRAVGIHIQSPTARWSSPRPRR